MALRNHLVHRLDIETRLISEVVPMSTFWLGQIVAQPVTFDPCGKLLGQDMPLLLRRARLPPTSVMNLSLHLMSTTVDWRLKVRQNGSVRAAICRKNRVHCKSRVLNLRGLEPKQK